MVLSLHYIVHSFTRPLARSFAFLVCSVAVLFARFSLLFMGINLLFIIIFNQLKTVLKHYEEISSCFNTYGSSAVEKVLSPFI